MAGFRETDRGFRVLGRRLGELLLIIFGPLIVTFLIVYYFPDQYHWLVETTRPFSMSIVTNMLRLVDMIPFIATDNELRSAAAMEIAFSGDNLFGCYVGVIAGSAISWYLGLKNRLARRLVRADE